MIEGRNTAIPAPLPDNEIERLAALHHFKILDTEPEQALRVLARQLGSQMEHRRNLMELEEALNTLKLLGGILPICASCKKIRNEEEQWDSLEKYIMEHSEATFTHGVCPDCVQRLYPEYRENKT